MNGNVPSGAWIESLEVRLAFSSIPQVAGIGYLLSDDGTRFQRYDIAHQKWLAPITLTSSLGGATATLVDGNGIYVAYGRNVTRYKLDGSSPTHLINATNDVHAIHSDGNLLFLNHSSGLYARLISIDKTSNTIIDSAEQYVDSIYGSSISTAANKIFGRSSGISPADITYTSYDDNGNFGAGGDSPYHGDYPNASTTWVFPLGTKVVDDSGGVYSTSDLTRLNSFGTTIDDIAFVGNDTPIVLRGDTLTAYTSAILPAGSKTLSHSATQILVNGTNVIAFSPDATDANGYSSQIVALTDLKAPQPGTPVDPVGLAYTPDDVELTAGGTLLLLDKETSSIFRWDSATGTYGDTIPLVNAPAYMAYSGVTNTIYVGYSSGLINSIALGATTPAEQPFAILPGGMHGLATAGAHVFAADDSGAWGTHYTFSSTGAAISAVEWNYYSDEYIWSAANSRMYFFRDDTSPNDLLAEPIGADGTIGKYVESPLHSSEGFQHPIRVSPDGSIIILGSGMVHDGSTLERKIGGLGNTVSDIAWFQRAVYTVRSIAGYAQFQQWIGSSFAPGAVAQVEGTPVALLSVGDDNLVGIYIPLSGVPQFRVMDADLQDGPGTVGSAAVTVTGTTGPDVITVTRNTPAAGGGLLVTVNGVTEQYGDETSIFIDGLAGNDHIVVAADVNQRILITGSGGNDTIQGGAGDDELSGANGKDRVLGSGGNDYLLAGASGDYLNGEAGDDTLSGAGGKDRLHGGTGHDSLIGGGGNDVLFGDADEMPDILSGGQGNDLVSSPDDTDLLAGIELVA